MATQRDGNEDEPGRLFALRRGLAVLEALAMRPEGATPKELSRELGLHISTCYRLLKVLVATGYAARGPDGLFRVGARVAYLHHGYLQALHPPPEALPFLHALQLATAETAVLSQLEGDAVVATATVAGTHPDAAPAGYVGLATPAHAQASGRVLLSGLPTPRLEAYLARHAALPDAPFPLPNPGAFRAELERIRQEGYALTQGQGHNDFGCIAAPIVDATSAIVAAITLVALQDRFQREEPALVTAVLTVANAISALRAAGPGQDAEIAPGTPAPERAARATIEAAITEIAVAMSRVGQGPVRKGRRNHPAAAVPVSAPA